MKKFIFNQIPRLQSVNLLKIKSFNRYFLKVFFMNIRTIFLQQIYLPTYIPTYLPTYRPIDQPTDRPTDRPANQPTDLPTSWLADHLTAWPPDRPTNWLIDRPTNRLTSQLIDPSIYLSTYIYIQIYISSFTAGSSGSIVDKSMKKKNILLLEKPGSILLKGKSTKQKMILVVEKLAITLYGPLVPFSKMMVRQNAWKTW